MNKLMLGIGLIGLSALFIKRAQARTVYYNDPSPLIIPPFEEYDAMPDIFNLPDNPTRGERNNNPGNIVKSNNPWVGKVAGDDPRFETFDTPQNGIRAVAKLVINYINGGHDTIRKIVQRYAPASENDVFSYINHVVQISGIGPDTKLNDSPDVVARIVNGIIWHENGKNIYADSGIMDQGLSLV